ncbi:MAG TPA: TVP38/TMEM64 family protein [Desulfobacterales bacterium]|jgi:uncharacterized membrane protein YdjX (TVP38/TMEM64 family)|nr:TVP38/TMEM64 family protein [Desulfobacterales bacterium]
MKKSTVTWLAAAGAVIIAAGILAASPGAWTKIRGWSSLLADREWIRATVQSFGWAGPLVFIGVQIAQVIAAPVPGEATGFIGGYLFGTLQGFFYSSIGLGIGSLLNFGIGRFLGERFVRRLIPEEKFKRIDRLVNRQGVIAILLMFVIPGFPKDYLSLALGLTTLPLKVFAILACIGRMPGTLVLSLKGASLYDQNYVLLAVVAAACLVMALLAYRFRDPIYRWVEKMNPPQDSA